jgi:hypothetical protein
MPWISGPRPAISTGSRCLTTVSRYLGAERHQIALPVARRSAGAFDTLAGSIDGDLGVNGSGTLEISPGVGSVAPFTQIAFAPTVSSPYGSTTFVVYFVRGAGPAGMSDQDVGACVLSSTLLGSGRATARLDLGSSGLQPCDPQLWSPKSKDPLAPRLQLAGIPHSGPT